MTLLDTKEELEAELDQMHDEISEATRAIAQRYQAKGIRFLGVTAGMCKEDERLRIRSCGNVSRETAHVIFISELQAAGAAKVIEITKE